MAKYLYENRLEAAAAAHQSWANTDDRAARTANGRAAFERKFLDEANGDPVKAEHLRKAYFLKLAARSVKSRARQRIAKVVDAENGDAA